MSDEERDIFEEIMTGAEEALEHARGELELPEHEVEVPQVDVKQLRGSLDLSQEEFADAFGLSVSSVQNWEQGRRSPEHGTRLYLHVITDHPELVNATIRRLSAEQREDHV